MQRYCDVEPDIKVFGRFYFSSDSSSDEEMLFLRGFQAISENDIGKFHRYMELGMSMSSTKYGIRPIEFAAVASSPSFVTSLFEQGLCFSSESVASPLHFAAAYGRADMVELFVERGLDPYVFLLLLMSRIHQNVMLSLLITVLLLTVEEILLVMLYFIVESFLKRLSHGCVLFNCNKNPDCMQFVTIDLLPVVQEVLCGICIKLHLQNIVGCLIQWMF
jgi:hypothetical protein